MINKFSTLGGGKKTFSGIFENCLVFIPAKKYINYFSGTTRIDSWKSNGISEENIENIIKSENIFTPTFLDHRILPDKNLNGNCSMNNTYIPKKVINI